MASSRRGRTTSLTVPLPSNTLADLPPISALFLIEFDVKAGYTIVWKRAEPALEIEGFVEYKSLPSGLHTVRDDLIYFVHDGAHAGLSAFINEPCEEEEARNARMIAVGVLVPLSYGRLGRAWRHAEGLKNMASKLAKDSKNTDMLERYWIAQKAKMPEDPQRPLSGETPLSSPAVTFTGETPTEGRKKHGRNRSLSDGGALAPSQQQLSTYHPAWSLTRLLDQFGPLIFPIHRAALLRKRILISSHAPVHEVCDFVYNLSILSNIPLSVIDILPTSTPTSRLHPLFCIGVHDIPFLMEDLESSKRRKLNEETAGDDGGSGWIACTTDSILAMKDTLWDMLITMPPASSSDAKEKVWPKVECPRDKPIKATQRDLRRFNSLRNGLARLAATSTSTGRTPSNSQPEISTPRPTTSQSNHQVVKDNPDEGMDTLIEPPSWAALAYNGYMWWASAGEQIRSEEQEESSRDAALLADITPATQSPMSMPSQSFRSETTLTSSLSSLTALSSSRDGEARVELAIIAYFHRLTTQMLSVLADIYEGAEEAYDDDDENDDDNDSDRDDDSAADNEGNDVAVEDDPLLDGGDDGGVITVDNRSVEMMGLDVWSEADASFVQGLMRLYFGRRARVEGKGVEVCGVKVC